MKEITPHFTIIDPQLIAVEPQIKIESNKVDTQLDQSSDEWLETSTSRVKRKRKYIKKQKLDRNLETTENGKAICPYCTKAVFK